MSNCQITNLLVFGFFYIFFLKYPILYIPISFEFNINILLFLLFAVLNKYICLFKKI